MCACVCAKERERERERKGVKGSSMRTKASPFSQSISHAGFEKKDEIFFDGADPIRKCGIRFGRKKIDPSILVFCHSMVK